MKTVTVKLRTVTPLFLGGAAERSCELRPPSIKGALRFWFRFIEGARQNGDWRRVREEEQRLFGSMNTGIGTFRIRMTRPSAVTGRFGVLQYREWPPEIGYMGYGPIELRRLTQAEKDAWKAAGKSTTVFEPKQDFIDAGCDLKFDLVFPSSAPEQDQVRIYEALWLWTHLGGFGSRARRGWGSLELLLPATFKPSPVTAKTGRELCDGLLCGINELIGTTPLASTPEYSYWFRDARILVPHVGQDWQGGMRWMGDKFIRFRSNATKFKFTFPPTGSKYPCWTDHDLLRNYLLPPGKGFVRPPVAPMRAVFGLPQNYGFGDLARGSNAQNPNRAAVKARHTTQRPDGSRQEEVIDRRASPLFVRLHPVQNGIAVVITVVPSALLPRQNGLADIRFEPVYDDPTRRGVLPIGHHPPIEHVPPPADWKTLDDFLATL
jgi:CRISPR-associated protein Cmr1